MPIVTKNVKVGHNMLEELKANGSFMLVNGDVTAKKFMREKWFEVKDSIDRRVSKYRIKAFFSNVDSKGLVDLSINAFVGDENADRYYGDPNHEFWK